MTPRFSIPVVVLGLTMALVLGTAVLAGMGAAAGNLDAPAPVLGALAARVVVLVAAGYAAGVLVWLALFVSRRDGWHRLEDTAFLPFNYGGRSPFDTSHWAQR